MATGIYKRIKPAWNKDKPAWNKGKKLSKENLENVIIGNRKSGLKKRGIMPKNLSSLQGRVIKFINK